MTHVSTFWSRRCELYLSGAAGVNTEISRMREMRAAAAAANAAVLASLMQWLLRGTEIKARHPSVGRATGLVGIMKDGYVLGYVLWVPLPIHCLPTQPNATKQTTKIASQHRQEVVLTRLGYAISTFSMLLVSRQRRETISLRLSFGSCQRKEQPGKRKRERE